jgi:uncharacterized membrane-anchored protein
MTMALAILLCLLLAAPATAQAQDAAFTPEQQEAEEFWASWDSGPATSDVGSMAEIEFDERFIFGGPSQAQALLQAWENPLSGRELGCLTPVSDVPWYVFFEFEDTGYVPDDEQDELDPDAMLQAIREGNERGNEERRRRGWAELEIIGWEVEPAYNPATNNLEWAILGRSVEGESINYDVRLLGRHGVMSAQLLCSPEDLDAALPEFREALMGFRYKSGKTYAEFQQGDKIAEYGLTALVTGGVLAGLAKAGILKKLLKPLIFVVVGVGAWLRRFLGRKSPATT